MENKIEKYNKQRIIYFDILNILACFCVIWLHCNSIVHQYTDSTAWKTSLIVETIAYWAVPVFIMLTGATLMEYRKKYNTKTFFKKRLVKTLIPFIVWSVIVLVWKYNTNRIQINNISIKSVFNILLLDKEEPIYWFFWCLFSIYLSLPVLSLLTYSKHRKILLYIVVVASLFNILPQTFKMIKIEWNSNFIFPVAGGFIVYVILGYLLSTQEIKRKYRILLYVLGILALIIRYVGTYYLSIQKGTIDNSLWGYTYFTGLFPSIAVFILAKNINWKIISDNIKIKKLLKKISSCSFGVYLIHRIIMAYEIRLLNIDVRDWKWRTIGAILTYLISLIIVFILKKFPVLRKIVP